MLRVHGYMAVPARRLTRDVGTPCVWFRRLARAGSGPPVTGTRCRRGDPNADGQTDLSDTVGALPRDLRRIELVREIRLDPEPPAPGSADRPSGRDPEASPNDLGCRVYQACGT